MNPLLTLLFTGLVWSSPSEPVVVGIAPFDVRAPTEDVNWLASGFESSIGRAAWRGGNIRLVERSSLDRVLQELRLQASSLVDPETAVRTGRLLGARVLINGEILLDAGTGSQRVEAHVRIILVETGETLAVVSVQGGVADLFSLQDEVAREVMLYLVPLGYALQRQEDEQRDHSFSPTLSKQVAQIAAIGETLPLLGQDPARRERVSEYQLALALSETILQENPNIPMVHYVRGLLFKQLGELDRAEVSLVTSIQLMPAFKEAHIAKANLQRLRGDLAEAVQILRALVEVYPDDGRIWYGMGHAFVRKGDEPQAVRAFVEAVRGRPAVMGAEVSLRALLMGSNGSRLSEGLQDSHLRDVSRLYRGLWMGDSPDLTAARRVSEAMPNLYLGHLLVGRALRGRDIADPEAPLLLALSMSPGSPPVHRELALHFFDVRDCVRGEDHLRLYVASSSAVTDLASLLAAMQACRN